MSDDCRRVVRADRDLLRADRDWADDVGPDGAATRAAMMSELVAVPCSACGNPVGLSPAAVAILDDVLCDPCWDRILDTLEHLDPTAPDADTIDLPDV